jgi:Trk-type K+ transport system membrane component
MVEPLERPMLSYIHTQFVTADKNSSVAEAVKILQTNLSDKAFKEALLVVVFYILFKIITALCIYYLGENKIIFIDTVFEAATTISNNGLTVGITTMDLNSISKFYLLIWLWKDSK